VSVVLVERSYASPVAFEDVQAIEDRNAWCLEAHSVTFLKSYFARDRQRMVFLYEAPDAETVRRLQEQAGLAFDRVWAARVVGHGPSEPSADAVLVERTLDPPLDEAAVHEAAARGAWCLEMYACRIVWSYLSLDGRRGICVFGGPDAESVRQAQRQAGMGVDRAWPASVHLPAPR
jgi:hypothetical protein